LRSQLELSQVRQEIDRRIQEKEEEFENTRWVIDKCLMLTEEFVASLFTANSQALTEGFDAGLSLWASSHRNRFFSTFPSLPVSFIILLPSDMHLLSSGLEFKFQPLCWMDEV
jgi:hypothetical protein